MAKKKATKREALQGVPQSTEELTKAVAHIGFLKRKINEITNGANEKIARIQEGVSE